MYRALGIHTGPCGSKANQVANINCIQQSPILLVTGSAQLAVSLACHGALTLVAFENTHPQDALSSVTHPNFEFQRLPTFQSSIMADSDEEKGNVAVHWSIRDKADTSSLAEEEPSIKIAINHRSESSSSFLCVERQVATSPSASQSSTSVTERGLNFRPSRRAMGGERVNNEGIQARAKKSGKVINPNYLGDFTGYDLRNSKCHPDENCALRIFNIHRDASTKEIFGVLKAFTPGRVLCYSYNEAMGRHLTAAISLTFMDRAAAERVVLKSLTVEGISLRGRRWDVIYNRDMVKPSAPHVRAQSRVIKVTGPSRRLSVRALEQFFRGKFQYELVETKLAPIDDDTKVIILHFISARPQGPWAYRLLSEKFSTKEFEHFLVEYAADPCDHCDR